MVWKKRTLKILSLLLVIILIYLLSAKLLLRTSIQTEFHIKNFYKEPKNSLDVAVIGASEMYTSYSAPLAYKEHGFTSYNLAFSGAPGKFYNYVIDEIYSRQKPQLLVMETNGFFMSQEYTESECNFRPWIDSIPKSTRWFKTINENVEPKERIDYYLNLIKYHSNWNMPRKQASKIKSAIRNSENEVSLMKSFKTITTMSDKMISGKTKKITPYGIEQLKNTIAHCKELGVKNVLFIRAPHLSRIDSKSEKQIKSIIDESGYKYLNCDKKLDEIKINSKQDFYNSEHLNVSGCEKFTKYLGDYIMGNYDIKIDHDEETKELWDKCVVYTEDAFQTLKERLATNEGLEYWECTDLSEEHHEKMLKKSASPEYRKIMKLKNKGENI